MCGTADGAAPPLSRGLEFEPWVWKNPSGVLPTDWGPTRCEFRLVGLQCGFLFPTFNGDDRVICSDIFVDLLPTIVKGAKLADMEEVERIPSSAEPTAEISYTSVDEELVGFDDHAENIIKIVRGWSNYLDVISIVGIAGIGKTALARKIFNSRSIIDHFDVRAWCSVGQIYGVRKLFLEILKQITGNSYVNVDDPNEEVRKHLFGKRYLIVLDDLWEDLAHHRGWYREPYFLPFLRDEESWELLQKKVFQGESCPLELRGVGPLVANKCKGLPLLIIMIAGILSRKKKRSIYVA
ncbi:hypothetical protein P3S68_033020 [Capsicum galapagoense]